MESYVTAPRDPEKKRSGFYIMRRKAVAASPQPDGRGVQFLYMDGERLITCARIVGNVTDEKLIDMLKTAEGFRTLVHSIGVAVEMTEDGSGAARESAACSAGAAEKLPETAGAAQEPAAGSDGSRERAPARVLQFVMQMYGKTDPLVSGTQIRIPVTADGMEQIIRLDDWEWSADDKVLGQFRFEFPAAGETAEVSVKLYLRDGFEAPEEEPEPDADLASPYYAEMVKQSLMQLGDPARLKEAIVKAKRGEDVTIAFIGGSITQGAGAVPINTDCYAYKTFERLCALAGKGCGENIHYIKAGVGGTPSELGMLRYERDVLRDGSVQPDIVVVEFAVNDAGDETGGECFDSLVRKILKAPNHPAVILLFAVFANDWNLQERLSVVGEAYALPMVSVRDAVVAQFYKKCGAGKVFSKSQFFYDCYHPTNLGHTVMADCIGYLFERADEAPEMEVPSGSAGRASVSEAEAPSGSAGKVSAPEMEPQRAVSRKDVSAVCEVTPPLGGEFEDVKLFDRSMSSPDIRVDCGSFCHTDEELQAVEMDLNLAPTKEFPYNWMHRAGNADSGLSPFQMDITCSALLLIYKDSGSMAVGKAEVWVDGEKVLTADPHLNGWTHCNPLICFRGGERKSRHVEVRMAPGDEEKEFTILGFGYVA